MFALVVLLFSQSLSATPGTFKKDLTTLMVGGSCAATAADFERTLNILLPAKVFQVRATDAIPGNSCAVSFTYMAESEIVFKTDSYYFQSDTNCIAAAASVDARAKAKWGKAALGYGCSASQKEYGYNYALDVTVMTNAQPLLRENNLEVRVKLGPADYNRVRSTISNLGATDILTETFDPSIRRYWISYFLPEGTPELRVNGADGEPFYGSLSSLTSSVNLESYDCTPQAAALEAFFLDIYKGMYLFTCQKKSTHYDKRYAAVSWINQKGSSARGNDNLWEQKVPVAGTPSFQNCMSQMSAVKDKYESLTGNKVKHIFCNYVRDEGYFYILAGEK